MEHYWNIVESTETSVIGNNFPQLSFSKGYNLDAPGSIFEIRNLRDDSLFQLDVPDFVLPKSSKLSDFLSCNGTFFVVSERVIQILNDFNLPPNKQYKCIVTQGNNQYPYTILYFIDAKYDFVDYKNSKFTLRYFKKPEKDNIAFGSKDSFYKASEEAYQILTGLLYADENQSITFDLFMMNEFQRAFFISDRLKEVFIKKEISGIIFLSYLLKNIIINN